MTKNKITSRQIAFVVFAAATGLLLNLFPITLYNDMSLIFGPAMSLLVAMSLGPRLGVITAAVVSCGLLYSWEHQYTYFVFGLFLLEALVVAILYKRGWNELLAVAFYWLTLAIPFALLLTQEQQPYQQAIDLTAKFLLNSFIYTLAASVILNFFSLSHWLRIKNIRSFSLKTQIFSILMGSMMIPILVISIYQSHHEQKQVMSQIENRLSFRSKQISRSIERIVYSSEKIIQHQAQIIGLSLNSDADNFQQLQKFQKTQPQFISLVIAEKSGQLTAFTASDVGKKKVNQINQERLPHENISDRDYFQAALLGKTFTSQVYKGRAKDDPIVTISSPIISAETKQVTGVLAGSLNLYNFEQLISRDDFRREKFNYDMLVLDKNNQVVHFTDNIKTNLLDTIDWQQKVSSFDPRFIDTPLYDGSVFIQAVSTRNGWKVYLLYPAEQFNQLIQSNYQKLAKILFLIIGFVSLLAIFLSHLINSPIQRLLKRISSFNLNQQRATPMLVKQQVAEEIAELIRTHESAEQRLQQAFKTEREAYQAKLNAEQASEEKSHFLSAMSHELRTPLNAISGFSQLLELHQGLDEEAKDYVNEISLATQYLMLLIDDVLDMSKIEAGQLVIKKSNFDLEELIQQTLPLLENQANNAKVEIAFLKAETRFELCNDSLRLKQVLINLLSNAIKYNKADGKVIVSLQKIEQSHVLIRISDTGIGIASERLVELFQRFNRLDNEGSSIDGYGIGLLISKCLLELMGGRIEVESEVDQGSCFSITLPLAPIDPRQAESLIEQPEPSKISKQNSQSDKVHAAEEANKLKPWRVLYVEDDQVNEIVMRRCLTRLPQLDYAWAADGHQAVERLSQEHFDLVLLDIALPDMSGFDVLNKMQTQYQQQYTKVFAVTANATQASIDQGLAAGFDEYITKPLEFEQLIQLIEKHQSIENNSDIN
jgi:signal transduction histidine kinase/ActR/RegA family two-component response regulator